MTQRVFISDEPEQPGEVEAAKEIICNAMEQWMDAGYQPASFLEAMDGILDEIRANVAMQMQ